jgi:hypothetical protein
MLSSSPSPLLSALAPLAVAGDPAAPAGEAAPGFAELLNGFATKAAAAVSGEEADAGPGAPADKVPTKGKTIAARAGRVTLADKPAAAAKDAPAAAQPATAAVAAIANGKILPEAAEAETEADADAATETLAAETTATPAPLPTMAGGLLVPLPVQAGEAQPVRPAATLPRRSVVAQALAAKVNPALAQPADKTKPEAQPAETRPAAAVAITVAAPAPIAAPATDEAAGAKPVASLRSKPVHAADLARIDAPLVQLSALPAAAQLGQADQSVQAPAAPTPPLFAPTPSPSDIDAALDHLVAAREALMPAEAALAIDHAEFGEVSIRFEQSPDGQLSAELTAADPELKRAVTAAVATGATITSDGDGGRSAQLAGHRGSAMTGGDAATGGRGQSGAQAGAERDMPQRRTPTHSPARRPATDQGSGVFA